MSIEPGRKPVLHTKKHVARLERERAQSRLILYAFIVILLSVLGLIGYGILDIKYLQLNKPVAKVGDVQILEKEFEARVRLQRQQLILNENMYQQYAQIFGMDTKQQVQQIEYYLGNPVILGQTVLDQMVNEELIRQEAAKRGITVSAAEVDKLAREQFKYFPDGTYTPTVTPTTAGTPGVPAEAYKIVTRTPTVNPDITLTPTLGPTLASTGTPAPTQTLEPTATITATSAPTITSTVGPTSTSTPTATPYTLEGYQTGYDKSMKDFTKLGFTEDGYRKLLEIQLLQDKLKEVVTADVPSTDEQIWARHILVPDEAQAISIIARLKAGEDFGKLARELSKDTGSATVGGDLGWFGKGAMVPEFEAAAFALKNPGDITPDPVKSQFGFHIIQLIAKQPRPLDPTQYEQAKTTAFTDWLTALHKDYKIETFDLWKARVPLEPSFSSMATESADAAKTQAAEAANATPTATP